MALKLRRLDIVIERGWVEADDELTLDRLARNGCHLFIHAVRREFAKDEK